MSCKEFFAINIYRFEINIYRKSNITFI
ncbi:hypothetical protein AAS23_gp59 [Pantoea phage vB_PagS_AAS23]|uniref:Uncharacterized protein n=1 Tax=Pantoea phage vB_PagS_AAS23 TaxID=2499073 RepID=A0A3S9U7U0_9CAUD|nr:hypothetical protein HOU93_gp59 [Pantoea phage vB_PagS_AAS23]AZS06372.1 hypothetical protein AAS23_gp59 [Pantoea phage vB_PagS_AAS23]